MARAPVLDYEYIGRITDRRDWSGIFRSFGSSIVKDWWTLTSGDAVYDNPASGFTCIRNRMDPYNGAPLFGNAIFPFNADPTAYKADFSAARMFTATIPALTGWNSFAISRKARSNGVGRKDFGIALANQDWGVAGGPKIVGIPRRTSGSTGARWQTNFMNSTLGIDNQTFITTNDTAINSNYIGFVAINFDTGQIKGAYGSNAPTATQTWADYVTNIPTFNTTNWGLNFGLPVPGEVGFDGLIGNVMRISGDIFAESGDLFDLRNLLNEFNDTLLAV